MTLPLWFRVATAAVLAGLLLIDLAVVARRPHAPTLRESSLWVGFYVSLAGLFAAVLSLVSDGPTAGQFVAGWLTEYSLSVDNLFVFVLIMSQFAVPRGNQQKVLMMGIILSLLLRGACILVGAAAIDRFSWIFYAFGGFLIYTAVQLARRPEAHDDGFRENAVIRRVCRLLPISDRYEGARLVTHSRGRRELTPMIVVFLAIGSTDLLFALDSIPAVFGLTQDPFVVFTATLFALMGLRQLYFLLGGLLDRLVYLSTGLAVILGFIGVKLVLEALHENELPFLNNGQPIDAVPSIPISVSLGTIVVVLALTTVASLLRSRTRAPEPGAQAGRAPASGVVPAGPGRRGETAGRSGEGRAPEPSWPSARQRDDRRPQPGPNGVRRPSTAVRAAGTGNGTQAGPQPVPGRGRRGGGRP
ncbi:MAG TPA: TerC/Alx family metal homeostasis membrane protein [Kineosporiaceae bacterium]